MRESAGAYNEVCRLKGKRTADVRVVISEGDVLLGFIGDEKRMEPTRYPMLSPKLRRSRKYATTADFI